MATEVRNRPTPPKAEPSAAQPASPPRRKTRSRHLLRNLVVLVLIAGLAFFAIKYLQERRDAKNLTNPQTAAAVQTADLVSKVGKLVELPSGQTPTIATVTDINKLQGQAFFDNAQNGDKVLIYTQSKKAILYRPSTNKVIEIAPLNIGSNQNASSSTSP